MNYIVTAEVYRTGFIIGFYPTKEQAEKAFNSIDQVCLKYSKTKQTKKLIKALSSFRKFKIRNDLLHPDECQMLWSHTGIYTISIFRARGERHESIERLIKAREYQATLFPLKMLDEMEVL